MPRLTAGRRHPVAFTLNGRLVEGEAEPRMLLTDFLRHVIGSAGTHVGCEHGVCGACTIQIDGAAARACLTLAVQVDGAEIRTVEGLAPEPGRLSVLQDSFRAHHGLQCGFCTPGILMSLDELLGRRPDASEDDIRHQLSGHLCRCTGYVPIMKAALAAAEQLRAGGGDAKPGQGTQTCSPPPDGEGPGMGAAEQQRSSVPSAPPPPSPPQSLSEKARPEAMSAETFHA